MSWFDLELYKVVAMSIDVDTIAEYIYHLVGINVPADVQADAGEMDQKSVPNIKTWICNCGACRSPLNNQLIWLYYCENLFSTAIQRIINERIHQKWSVMQNDADQTDDPALRKLILWRMGDQRIIAANKQ